MFGHKIFLPAQKRLVHVLQSTELYPHQHELYVELLFADDFDQLVSFLHFRLALRVSHFQ